MISTFYRKAFKSLFVWAIAGILSSNGNPLSAFDAQNISGSSKVSLTIRGKSLEVEVASTNLQRAKGLMFRRKLRTNDGMLFLMPRIGSVSFWMKNTYIPLSIAYLDIYGNVLQIEDKRPLDTSITHTFSNHVAYVLEVNLHWFRNNGVKTGDTIISREAPLHLGSDS